MYNDYYESGIEKLMDVFVCIGLALLVYPDILSRLILKKINNAIIKKVFAGIIFIIGCFFVPYVYYTKYTTINNSLLIVFLDCVFFIGAVAFRPAIKRMADFYLEDS